MIDNLGESSKLLLARAARISTELRHYYIGTEHLFLAAVAAALRATLARGDWSPDAYSERRAVEQPGTEVSTGVLEQFGRDLTQLARQGELQPIIGRESEILQVIQILMAEH